MARFARRSSGFRRGGRQQRRMDWGGWASAVALNVAGGSTSSSYLYDPVAIRTDLVDPTLIRLRLSVVVIAQAANDALGAFGVIAWSDINATIPAAGDLPLPYTQPNLDWIVWAPWMVNATPAGTFVSNSFVHGGDILDSRAMRRLGNDRGLLFVIENSGTSLTSVDFTAQARFLIKE